MSLKSVGINAGIGSINGLITPGTNISITGSGTAGSPYNISSAQGNAPSVLSTITGISAFSIANTALYTVPFGKTCIITGYTVKCTAASGITNGASAGIGNIAGNNNISASQAMNALTTTSTVFQWDVIGMSINTAASGIIYFNLGNAATGTSQTLSVDIIGYIY